MHRKARDVGLGILLRGVFPRLRFQRGDTSLESCGGRADGVQLPSPEDLGFLEAPGQLRLYGIESRRHLFRRGSGTPRHRDQLTGE